MKKRISLSAFILSCSISGIAQSVTCGTDQVHNALMANDPGYAHSIIEMSERWSQYNLNQQKIIPTSNGPVYEIPTVVHIIHTGGAIGTFYNPADLQIQNWITYFNETYASQSALFVDTLHGGVSIPIRLVLAARDPNCNPTNGIERIDGTVFPNYATDGLKDETWTGAGVIDTTIKAYTRWPAQSYYNIWLVNKINNGALSGYATFPTSPPAFDGSVIETIISQPNLFTDATFPHELGHAFGVLHTFQGSNGTTCPPNANCSVDGDGICDTEPHLQPSGCPTGINSCTGVNFNDVQFNFMNYTNCRDRFTAGQKSRMLFSLLNYRYSLLTSLGATPPGNDPMFTPPLNLCTPTGISNQSNNFNVGPRNISLADMMISTQGYSNDGNKFYWDHTISNCMQPQAIAHLKKDSVYTVTVTTGANAESVRGWIDFNNDGAFSNSELIISRNGTLAWETHTATFTVTSAGMITCIPLRMRIASDLSGISLQPCSNPQYGQIEDFMVIISTLTPGIAIAAAPGTNVATGSSVTFSATAINSGTNPQYEWRKNGQPIAGINTPTWSAIAGSGFVSGDRITARLRSADLCVQPDSAVSNVLTMQTTATGINTLSDQEAEITLYPNPNDGNFIIDGAFNQPGEYEMVIKNTIGQKVYEKTITTTGEKLHSAISLDQLPRGVYVLTLSKEQAILKTLKFITLQEH